jgi:hypothetical protein
VVHGPHPLPARSGDGNRRLAVTGPDRLFRCAARRNGLFAPSFRGKIERTACHRFNAQDIHNV